MAEPEVLNNVDRLGGKIAHLISRFQEIHQKLGELEAENRALREEVQKLEEALSQVNENHKTQTLTHLLTQGKEKAEVKAQIERIVRDIDRCIGLLSQPDLE